MFSLYLPETRAKVLKSFIFYVFFLGQSKSDARIQDRADTWMIIFSASGYRSTVTNHDEDGREREGPLGYDEM